MVDFNQQYNNHLWKWKWQPFRGVWLFATPWTHPQNSPGQNTGVGSLSLLQGIFPIQGSEPRSPTLQADSLPTEPQGKLKNTGVGSLSLLQRIFPTQELNQGLPQYRRILYQLSYQGSPDWGNACRQNLMKEREARQGRGSRSSGLRFQVKPDPQGGSNG